MNFHTKKGLFHERMSFLQNISTCKILVEELMWAQVCASQCNVRITRSQHCTSVACRERIPGNFKSINFISQSQSRVKTKNNAHVEQVLQFCHVTLEKLCGYH